MDKPLTFVTHGQCDTWLTATFPAIGHHQCPSTGTKLLGNRGIVCAWTTCSR